MGLIAVIAVVVVVLVGIPGGGNGGGGGGSARQNFIMEDASRVTIINVAAIMASEEIPGVANQLMSHIAEDPNDTEEWKDEYERQYPVDDRFFVDHEETISITQGTDEVGWMTYFISAILNLSIFGRS